MTKQGIAFVRAGVDPPADGSITGDVDFGGAESKVSHVAPTPCDVGPTILIADKIDTAERALQSHTGKSDEAVGRRERHGGTCSI